MNKLASALCGLFVLAGMFPAHAEPAFTADRLADHIKLLASDAFGGRGPGTEGEAKSVAYIIDQFKAANLKPAGDRLPRGGRAWTQDVPLARFEITGPVDIRVRSGGAEQAWSQGDQVAFRASATGADAVRIENAPVVFVGYGITAPERNWDDFKDVDLKGKIALVLVNDPDFESGQGDFGGRAMTYYGRWTYKYEEAARRGALGMLVIHETAPASYGWATVRNSNTISIFDIIRPDASRAHPLLEGWIQRDAAAGLLRAAGLDFEALKQQAQMRAFQPVNLDGVALSVRFRVAVSKIITRNVLGEVAGRRRPAERVIYTAHWDHLGVGPPDATGDRIYNGAVDNGTGVAALIELGRAFAGARRPARTVMFMALTAEEKGLLGSTYYAANPLYPLATTAAVLNMDGLAPIGLAHDFSTSGDGPTSLQDDLIAGGLRYGRYYSPDPRPETGMFFRSDHFPFAKMGVPAISFISGADLFVGGKAAGTAAQLAYIAERYHQPSDQWREDFDLSGAAKDMSLLYDLGAGLADSRRWPVWKPGSEFKAVRDRSAGVRGEK